MTSHTIKRVIQEVGVAARETPRLYFAGVKDFAAVFGRWMGSDAASQDRTKTAKHLSSSASAGNVGDLRHGKKHRSRAKK